MPKRLRFASLLLTLAFTASAYQAWGEEGGMTGSLTNSDLHLTPPPVAGEKPDNSITLQAVLTKTEPLPIDLPVVLKLVEDQNLNIAQNQWNARIAKSQYRLSEVALLPNVAETLTQSHLKGGVQIFGGQVVTIIRDTVQPQLTGTWTLYPGGKSIYDILAANRRKKAADFQLKETYQQQLSLAAQEYYQLLAAQYQQLVAARSVAQAQEQVKFNDARVRIGTGTKLELMQAQTLFAQQQQGLIQAENAIAQAEQVLLDRLNLDPTIRLVATQTNVGEQRLIPETTTAEALLAWANQNNPTLKRIQEQIQAFRADYGSVRSGFLPSVTLNTYLNGTGPKYDQLVLSRFGGFTVNLNLLDNLGLKVPFQLQQVRGEINRTVVEQKLALRQIQTQLLSAFLDSRAAASSIQTARLERVSAAEALRLAIGRYKAGVGINLDVINAQVALTTAENNVIRAVLNFNQAQVRVLEAMGAVEVKTLVSGIQPLLQPAGNSNKGNTSNGNTATP